MTLADSTECSDCGQPMRMGSLGVPICPTCMLLPALKPASEITDPGPPAVQSGPVQMGDDELRMIGSYQLIEKVGEGGFGFVYRAEQLEPVRRTVAIKILKPGMDSQRIIARFEAERQSLAAMDHPGIARVFDGGTTERGRPWFAMEFVWGVSITDYCDKNRLSLQDRIKLVIRLCAALEHAHRRGVVHRDLKPENILVTLVDGEPTPKVIDFGVAKAIGLSLGGLANTTRSYELIGTPVYMSPEHLAGNEHEIDHRADIFSLGTILFELAVGDAPRDRDRLANAGLHDLSALLAEDLLPASTKFRSLVSRHDEIAYARGTVPARLSRQLKGDLDHILTKAVEQNPDHRYLSAREFAEDLNRFLAGEAVCAHAPSLGYRLQRLAHRGRVALVAFFLGVFTLASFLVVQDLGREKVKAEFLRDAHDHAVSIQRTVESNLQQIESIAAFVAAKHGEISATEFRTFVSPYLARNRNIQALEWVPEVRLGDLERHELEMRGTFPEYAVYPRSADQPDEDRFYPIALVEPIFGNESVIGFNLGSSPERRQAIRDARRLGRPSATEPVDLIQGERGLLVFWPAFDTNRQFLGFALCVFRTASIIESSVAYLDVPGIHFKVSDEDAESKEVYFEIRPPGNVGLFASKEIKVADRVWTVDFQGSRDYWTLRRTWHEYGILLIGLLATLFAGSRVHQRYLRWR